MQDRLKEIPQKILEWWGKFSMKQKMILCGAAVGVLTAVIVLVSILTRPTYIELAVCGSTADAAEIVALLEDESLTYRTDSSGLRIEVLKSQESRARLLLGENDIPSTAYTIDDALSGGLSTTESDKQRRMVRALQDQLERDLEAYSFVKNAFVILDIPQDDGTLISSGEESSASVLLELSGELTADMARGIAHFVATGLGNETTNHIVIMDMDGNMYFSGSDEISSMGAANSQITIKQQTESALSAQVRAVLSGTGEFSMISVAPNLDLDFSTATVTDHTYGSPEGGEGGLTVSEDRYESNLTSGYGGVPGTTTNGETGDTTYVLNNGDGGSETVEEYHADYALDEHIATQTIPPGLVRYGSSTISVTTIHYNIIREEDARRQGLLDGISWAEYQAANSERVKLETDEDWVSIVANATSIPRENITFIAYSENMFVDKEGSSVEVSDVLQVLLIIIILALLAFVVLRSMRGEKKQDSEEELSVETLLQSVPQEDLEDINLEEKSETRKMIEKFVDENPEAVANLLRNWLNEDWG